MQKLGFRAFALFVVVLFVLWGCTATETKPSQEEASSTAKEQVTAEKSDISKAAVESKVEEPVPQEPVVETMPRKEVVAPIVMEPIPAPAATAEPESSEAKSAEVKEEAAPVVSQPAEPSTQAATAEEGAVQKPVSQPLAGEGDFVVTLQKKDATHPSYGKGHGMGFAVNGVQGKSLVLVRGKTYKFDVKTDPKHDVYLSKKPIGWGSAPYTEGVSGAFIYEGIMTFTPGKDAPEKLYYACRNHPYMGGEIHIINPGETVDLTEAKPDTAEKSASAAKSQLSEAAVRQKIMFAEMMSKSQGAKRVVASQNTEAKQTLEEARENVAQSHEKLKAGDLAAAMALADKSIKLVGQASRLVPSDEALAEQAAQYDTLLKEISNYETSHEQNHARLVKAGKTPPAEAEYNKAQVSKLKAEAAKLAGQKNYGKANELLQEVQHTITVAIQKMLHSQTIVYDLNFETPKDEYEYELKRFNSYEELIPVAIETKKPAEGAIKLMESFLEKARKRRDEAAEKAAAGAYPDAIAMMQQATTTVRRALRMVGVTQ